MVDKNSELVRKILLRENNTGILASLVCCAMENFDSLEKCLGSKGFCKNLLFTKMKRISLEDRKEIANGLLVATNKLYKPSNLSDPQLYILFASRFATELLQKWLS